MSGYSLPWMTLILKCTVTSQRLHSHSPGLSSRCLLLCTFTCPPSTHFSHLHISNGAVAPLPRTSLGCSSRGWSQPNGDLVSKTSGRHREGGRRRGWEVEELQHCHAHAAAPCKHAGGSHPFVAAWVVLFDRVKTGAAIIPSHSVQPAVHSHQVMSAPTRRWKTLQYSNSVWTLWVYSIFLLHFIWNHWKCLLSGTKKYIIISALHSV